jgi:hypothetical protein
MRCVIRVEGVDVEFPFDVGDGAGAEDVEGEGAEPGDVARFGWGSLSDKRIANEISMIGNSHRDD